MSRDIVIWKGGRIVEIIEGESAYERNEAAHEWFTKNIPEYDDTKMIRIQ